MFAAQLEAAIEGAFLNQLDELARNLWKAYAAELVGDDEAQRLAEAIASKREGLRGLQDSPSVAPRRFSIFKPRRLQRPPQRAKAIERRRILAASGPLPPRLAGVFTTGMMAVLRIVADEAKQNAAQCSKSIAEIAARAGVCHRLAQYTLRLAERHRLVAVEHRPQRGAPNLVSIVRIVCGKWLAWLMGGGGCRNVRPTGKKVFKKDWVEGFRPVQNASQRATAPPGRAF